MRRLAFASLSVLALAACDSAGTNRIVTVNATGTAIGVAFIDRNGNSTIDQGDLPLPGVRVAVTPRGGTQVVASGVTNATGLYILSAIPVGSYHITVDSATLGDSLRIARIDTADITIGSGDTIRTTIAFAFPGVAVAQARALPAGRKVQVLGIAQNGWAAFGDSSIAVLDATGAIRVTRVAPVTVSPGDSVRVTGTSSTFNGQPVITSATVAVLASGKPLPTPPTLSTAQAATAAGGRWDAQIVQVARGTILSAVPAPTGELDLSVDDGSGLLHVLLTPRGFTNALYTPGAQLAATGVMVPAAGGQSFVLRPRADADLQVSFLGVTIAQARTLPVGRQVQLTGLALNGWATFGDSTIHVLDNTGALRSVRVRPASVFAGDSIRLVGVIASRDGQTILTSVDATVLAAGRSLPDPGTRTTAVANTANNGADDANVIKVVNAAVKDTLTLPNGDYRLHVDDGSGPVTVILDRDLGLRLTPFIPGVSVDMTGVLIPNTGGGSWQLKPRSALDTNVR